MVSPNIVFSPKLIHNNNNLIISARPTYYVSTFILICQGKITSIDNVGVICNTHL